MKKYFIFLLVFTVIFTNITSLSYANVDANKDKIEDKAETESKTKSKLDLKAETAILINSQTGEALFEKESNKEMFPASTTKILTAIIAIENSDLQAKVIIDEETGTQKEGTHLALITGEVFTMEQLLNALLISSANDSAVAIAKHVSGSVENFATLMNQEARRMGAKNSNFTNPSGMPDQAHVSTAYDLAVIAKYAMKNDIFREIVKKPKYKIDPTNKQSEPRLFNNSNKLLFSNKQIKVDGKSTAIKYDGVLGIKTGYTEAAQQCMVSAVDISGNEYISVILHSVGTDIYVDTHKLFNYSSKNSKPNVLAKKNEFIDNIKIDGGNIPFITAVLEKDFNFVANGESISNIEKELVPTPKLKLPIEKGQVVGKVNFKSGDKVLGSVNVVSSSKIISDDSKINNILDYTTNKWWFWLLLGLIVLRTTVGIRRVMYRARRLKEKKRELRKKSRKKGQTTK